MVKAGYSLYKIIVCFCFTNETHMFIETKRASWVNKPLLKRWKPETIH